MTARPLMSDEQKDYSEIYTPTTEDNNFNDGGGCWSNDPRADGGGSAMTSAMSGLSGKLS